MDGATKLSLYRKLQHGHVISDIAANGKAPWRASFSALTGAQLGHTMRADSLYFVFRSRPRPTPGPGKVEAVCDVAIPNSKFANIVQSQDCVKSL